MSRKLIIALIAALAAMGWVISTPAAYAGGPTSVLAVNLDTGAAAGIYHSNPQYERLATAIDANGSVGTQTEPPAAIPGSIAPNVRLTWLIHDQSVWRFDQIYFVGDQIWVQTTTDGGGGMTDPYDQTGYWHQPKQATLLHTVLNSLDEPVGSLAPVPPPANPPVDVPAAPTATSSVGPAAATGAGGLVLGFAGAILWRRQRQPRPDRMVLEG